MNERKLRVEMVLLKSKIRRIEAAGISVQVEFSAKDTASKLIIMHLKEMVESYQKLLKAAENRIDSIRLKRYEQWERQERIDRERDSLHGRQTNLPVRQRTRHRVNRRQTKARS